MYVQDAREEGHRRADLKQSSNLAGDLLQVKYDAVKSLVDDLKEKKSAPAPAPPLQASSGSVGLQHCN
jgi:hypothetical protein